MTEITTAAAAAAAAATGSVRVVVVCAVSGEDMKLEFWGPGRAITDAMAVSFSSTPWKPGLGRTACQGWSSAVQPRRSLSTGRWVVTRSARAGGLDAVRLPGLGRSLWHSTSLPEVGTGRSPVQRRRFGARARLRRTRRMRSVQPHHERPAGRLKQADFLATSLQNRDHLHRNEDHMAVEKLFATMRKLVPSRGERAKQGVGEAVPSQCPACKGAGAPHPAFKQLGVGRGSITPCRRTGRQQCIPFRGGGKQGLSPPCAQAGEGRAKQEGEKG